MHTQQKCHCSAGNGSTITINKRQSSGRGKGREDLRGACPWSGREGVQLAEHAAQRSRPRRLVGLHTQKADFGAANHLLLVSVFQRTSANLSTILPDRQEKGVRYLLLGCYP